MTRQLLPNRREARTFGLNWYGTDFTVSIGLFADGMPAECFVTGAKSGVEVQSLSRDGAILLSLALQYGAPLDVIAHSITRNPDGSPQSFIGALVESIKAEMQR